MTLKDLVYISLFTAIIGALAIFPPVVTPFTPVPITAQTLGVMLAGGLLGARRGGISLLLFICLVAVGAPLMAGGRGGLGLLLGPGGGYVLAWPLAAWVIGYLTERSFSKMKFWKMTLFNILGGIIVTYLIGITYTALVADLPWLPTAVSALTFLPGDLMKVFIASALIVKMNQVYPVIESQDKHAA